MIARRSAKFAKLAPPGDFADISDDFDSGNLDNWTIDNGSWNNPGFLLQNLYSGNFTNGRIRLTSSGLFTASQYAKYRFIGGPPANEVSPGVIFRSSLANLGHYQVIVKDGNLLSWERYDPDYVERMGTDVPYPALSADSWIGFVIEGVGPSTQVKGWNFGSTDPDSGGTPDPNANWGPADSVITTSGAAGYVDSGDIVGVRTYRSYNQSVLQIDDFFAGDYR